MLETAKQRSPIHQINPIAKMVWVLCMVIIPILVTNPYILILLTFIVWLMAPLAGITRKLYSLLIKTYPVMVGFIMLMWPFFYRGGTHVLIPLGITTITLEGIIYALAMGLRIVLAVTACTFFVMVTDIMDLASAIGELLQRWFKASFTYPLMIISSFKFLPEFMADFVTIQESFMSRGSELDKGSLAQRIRKTVPLFIPLIDSTLKKAQNIAIAMQLKAFGISKQRTFFKQHPWGLRDIVFMLFGILCLLLAIYARIQGIALLQV